MDRLTVSKRRDLWARAWKAISKFYNTLKRVRQVNIQASTKLEQYLLGLDEMYLLLF